MEVGWTSESGHGHAVYQWPDSSWVCSQTGGASTRVSQLLRLAQWNPMGLLNSSYRHGHPCELSGLSCASAGPPPHASFLSWHPPHFLPLPPNKPSTPHCCRPSTAGWHATMRISRSAPWSGLETFDTLTKFSRTSLSLFLKGRPRPRPPLPRPPTSSLRRARTSPTFVTLQSG
jgi:hypothetical protein